ncbi:MULTISPECIES: hypothetical protein [Flavobacterium]|jgi:hypothetical protein|uniref:Pentapeptide MXKDX repeat protein n=1 Tax=Flavobacterium cupriresistens TaxID=2893885 RepID=A0ABU4RET0_9FLAO|nr:MULTISPECIES: hypothetical protein [unclassified Flavobacterium]MDX6189970.1 hypothetical protein [Flavobacterium sp. Fl-318]UFH42795.1 hypothetical protein LNP23_00920 [Flavobacterium sp. F-323]
MTKVITVLTVALFSVGISAQETKPAAKKETAAKTTSKEKSKSDAKTCDMSKKDSKKCCSKKK